MKKHITIICLLFVAICMYAGNKENKVIKVDIYYYHEGGYALTYSHAIYKRNNNVFEFHLEDWRETNNVMDSPIAFYGYFVDKFVSEMPKMVKDTCDAYKISKNDIDNYRNFLHEDLYFSIEDIDKNKYQSIQDQTLLDLTCNEISEALYYKDFLFYSLSLSKPLKQYIVLTFNDGNTVELRPHLNFSGIPWMVKKKDEIYFLDYNFFYNFIKEIGWEKHFPYLNDRDSMVFKVVSYLISKQE